MMTNLGGNITLNVNVSIAYVHSAWALCKHIKPFSGCWQFFPILPAFKKMATTPGMHSIVSHRTSQNAYLGPVVAFLPLLNVKDW